MNPALKRIVFRQTTYPKTKTYYTPLTMVEWTVDAGSTKGASGIHLVKSVDNYAYRATSLTPNTKYLLLYNVVATDADSTFQMTSWFTGSNIVLGKTVGNNKSIFTTQATISTNRAQFFLHSSNTDGKYINFKDIRVIELIPGSQLETDANTLTADQLNAKYPFNRINRR